MSDVAVPGVALLELEEIGKTYDGVDALRGVTLDVRAGQVTCVLGDNGAGKSTLIKVIAGLHQHSSGVLRVEGEETTFSSPRQAQDAGIATVYQDLALAPMLSVWRNFFLGNELTSGVFRSLDEAQMKRITGEELTRIGIDIPDLDRPVGSLSGGQRQCVAIARAVYFGAKVVVLDEPTASLGVKQSGVVLRYIDQMRADGVGVVFITHNPQHAYLVGDQFIVLKLGRIFLDERRENLTLEQLTTAMAGGGEMDDLAAEIEARRAG